MNEELRMNKGHIILTVTLIFFVGSEFVGGGFMGSKAWAQDEQQPAGAPVPAFGQESPAPTVSENPPISAIDQPGLEPHAAPESFLLPGLHFSESVESNVGNTTGGSSVTSVTRALGSLTLQKLWKNYDVAMDYIGGVSYYDQTGLGVQQLQQFDIDNRINWKRGQLAIRDSFSYLPEGTFGFGAYGGGGAYNAGIGSMGSGLLGAGAFGGQTSAFAGGNGLNISLGVVPRITNFALADVVEELTPKSSVTFAAGYGLVHFYGNLETESLVGALQENVSFIGSSEYTGQVAYDRILNPKDQIAVSYGYQAFDFSTVGTAFHSNVIQLMYGHRISGRLDFMISAGPQFTRINQQECDIPTIPASSCAGFGGTVTTAGVSRIGAAGRVSLHYKFPRTTVSLSYQRYDTNGSGIFAGAQSDIVQFDARRPLSRVWDVFTDVGYSRNSQLQVPGAIVSAGVFSYVFAGAGLHRQFGRNLRGFVSYQFNDLSFNNGCPLGTTTCSSMSQNHVGSIGLDWTPRPIRLD
ncbi:MAG: hypothetical protein WA510_16550 [Acidobacteriaceae bacterium]